MTGTRKATPLDAHVFDYFELMDQEFGGFTTGYTTYVGGRWVPGCLLAAASSDETAPRDETNEIEKAFRALGIDAPEFERAVAKAGGLKGVDVYGGREQHYNLDFPENRRVPWAKIAVALNIVRGPHMPGALMDDFMRAHLGGRDQAACSICRNKAWYR